MRIQVEKFLALTALLATTAALGVGCTTEDTATTTDAGVGGGGTGGGGTGGTAGQATGGAAGTAATGGTAGQATGGTGGTTDGGACLGDTPSNPDAGTEGSIIDCTTLSYYTTSCPDAGTETLAPLGVDFCDYVSAYGRAAVQEKVFECLKTAPTTDLCAVGGAHDTAVQKCMDDAYTLACDHAPLTVDGAAYDPCKDIASSCTAGDAGAGVTEAECNFVLNPLSTSAIEAILLCYDGGTGTCEADFETCVGLP